MKALPNEAASYKRTPLFNDDTVPKGLLNNHHTKEGIWGLIHVEQGVVHYTIEDKEHHILTPGFHGVIEPQVSHCVRLDKYSSFFIEFYTAK